MPKRKQFTELTIQDDFMFCFRYAKYEYLQEGIRTCT